MTLTFYNWPTQHEKQSWIHVVNNTDELFHARLSIKLLRTTFLLDVINSYTYGEEIIFNNVNILNVGDASFLLWRKATNYSWPRRQYLSNDDAKLRRKAYFDNTDYIWLS